MSPSAGVNRSGAVPLVEVLDRVIDRGAVVSGDAVIALADVDLIRVVLHLAVLPADRVGDTVRSGGVAPAPARGRDRSARTGSLPARRAPDRTVRPGPERRSPEQRSPHQGSPERRSPHQGLAQLVLTVVELLRELLDRQAVRRAGQGRLTDDEAERLGVALLELDAAMDEVVAAFGLDREDLNLDLGPLGPLL